MWNARPENRQLPSLLQWLQNPLADAEEELDAAAAEDDGEGGPVSCGAGAGGRLLVLALLGWGGYEGHGTAESPCACGTGCWTPTRTKCRPSCRTWLRIAAGSIRCCTKPMPRPKQSNDARKQLHASLALLPVDASQVEYLYGRLLDAEPHEVPVIRDALAPHKDELLDKLWAVVETPEKGKESQRLRAAAALAKYDPESEKWAKASGPVVVNDLVRRTRCFWASGCEAFRPVKGTAAGAAGRHLSEIANRRDIGTHIGDEHPGRLRRRPAAGSGRSADGRRREAVRRDLSEVQGAWRARACPC